MSATARGTTLHRHLRIASILAIAAMSLAACGDAADLTAPTYRPQPVAPSAMRAEVLATVDLESGTMTFEDRKSTRLNSSHSQISYAVFCLKKKNNDKYIH